MRRPSKCSAFSSDPLSEESNEASVPRKRTNPIGKSSNKNFASSTGDIQRRPNHMHRAFGCQGLYISSLIACAGPFQGVYRASSSRFSPLTNHLPNLGF